MYMLSDNVLMIILGTGFLGMNLFFWLTLKKMMYIHLSSTQGSKEHSESSKAMSDIALIRFFTAKLEYWLKVLSQHNELNQVTITSIVSLAKRHRILLKPTINLFETALKSNSSSEMDKVLKELKGLLQSGK